MRVAIPESRRMVFLYGAAGAVFATIGARGLTVPLYAHQLGANRFEVGALFAVSTIAAAALSLPSGVLVDRFGARTLLGISLVITAGAFVATALTSTVPPLFAWQVLTGLAAGIQQAALFSAVTESVSRSRLGRAMGWLTLSMQVGFFVGPAAAGIALSWIDLRADIALTTVALLLTVPGAIATSNTTQRSGAGLSIRGPLRALMSQPAFAQVTVGLIGVTLMWGTLGAFLPVFGKEALRLPSSQVGYLLALQAVVNGASRIPAGRLVDAVHERWRIVAAGGVVWSVAAVVLSHTTGFLAPALVLMIGTPFMAAAFVTIGVIFGELSSHSTRGVTMGMYGTVLFAGLSAGPLLFGPIVQNAGYAAGFTACSIAAVALLVGMAAMQAPWASRRPAAAPRGDSETQAAATRRA
ncbi:MAG TPA: MFS transporter [Candidatus Udaeobacter sp.]|nr:MFS transporter [Candidatus Udaeobacter sp.]